MNSSNCTYCVMPARGGSKRIPKKNIRGFCGQPVIARSIALALRSGLFERVIVSTDDPEVVAIARDAGAEVPFDRPASLSDDYTGTIAVVRHAIDAMSEQGFAPDIVCCLYPAAPFVTEQQLVKALNILQSGSNVDFVFPAARYSPPIQRGFTITESGEMTMLSPERFSTRSQDLEEVFHDTGQFYFARRSTWQSSELIFSPNSRIVEIGPYDAIDIDDMEDWRFAEQIFSIRNND